MFVRACRTDLFIQQGVIRMTTFKSTPARSCVHVRTHLSICVDPTTATVIVWSHLSRNAFSLSATNAAAAMFSALRSCDERCVQLGGVNCRPFAYGFDAAVVIHTFRNILIDYDLHAIQDAPVDKREDSKKERLTYY